MKKQISELMRRTKVYGCATIIAQAIILSGCGRQSNIKDDTQMDMTTGNSSITLMEESTEVIENAQIMEPLSDTKETRTSSEKEKRTTVSSKSRSKNTRTYVKSNSLLEVSDINNGMTEEEVVDNENDPNSEISNDNTIDIVNKDQTENEEIISDEQHPSLENDDIEDNTFDGPAGAGSDSPIDINEAPIDELYHPIFSNDMNEIEKRGIVISDPEITVDPIDESTNKTYQHPENETQDDSYDGPGGAGFDKPSK